MDGDVESSREQTECFCARCAFASFDSAHVARGDSGQREVAQAQPECRSPLADPRSNPGCAAGLNAGSNRVLRDGLQERPARQRQAWYRSLEITYAAQ